MENLIIIQKNLDNNWDKLTTRLTIGNIFYPKASFKIFSNRTSFQIMVGSGRRTFMIMENMGLIASSRKWNLTLTGFGLGQEYSWNFGAAILKEFTLFNRREF